VTREHRNTESGQAVLEFLLVLMILAPLLFGGIELARGVGIRHALDSGVGVATRALSLDPTQWSWAATVISQSVTGNPLGGGAGTTNAPVVKVYNAGGTEISATTLASLPFGSAFRLAASVTYTPDVPLVGGQMVTIRVSHWGIVERYP
jgi:Flp pilus assembly protein TadG